MKKIIPIKALFDMFEASDIEYEKELHLPILVKIKTPNGFRPINAIVKKKTKTSKYYLENGESVSCSINHLLYDKKTLKKAKECSYIDTVAKPVKVIGEDSLGEQDVYDVALDAPHEYVTPNGVIHHNTTLAKLLLKEFGVPGGDILEINGSNEGRKIEILRDKLEGFSLSYSLGGGLRYVLLDEADYLNPHSVQPALRNLMEKCADSCRYILTCNYPHKIIPPLHSRVQQIQFEKLDNTEFTTRSIEVLMNEDIEFDPELIAKYVDMTYPDLRKCINLLQQNSVTGKLTDPDLSTGGDLDFLVESMDLFAKGKIIEARKIICSQAREDDYPAIYKFLYENVDKWFDDATLQDDVYIFLAKYLHQNSTSDDREINLAGCLSAISKLIG